MLPDSEEYLCPVDEAVYIEAYGRLASVQRCFYTQTFEEIALTYFNLLGIDANNNSPDSCVCHVQVSSSSSRVHNLSTVL